MFPEIRISDSIVIPSYLLSLSVLYCFLIFYVWRKATAASLTAKNQFDLKTALDLGLILMVAGFLGARLLHVLYESPEFYQQDFSRIYQFWEGGFVFYGGFLFALIGVFVYLRLKKLSFLLWADFYAPVLALGYGLGRFSCFLAGCCYGRSCELPWAVTFPWDGNHVLRHPTQLYAMIWELAVFVLLTLWPRWRSLRTGLLFSTWLILHGLGRLMMEFFREDFRGATLAGLSLSSWISFAVIFLGLGLAHRLSSRD